MIFPESDRLFQKFILMKICSGTAMGVGRKDGVRIHLVHNQYRFRAVVVARRGWHQKTQTQQSILGVTTSSIEK